VVAVTTAVARDEWTRIVWLMIGCMLIAMGVGAEVILFGANVVDPWPLAFHGPFWLWAALILAIAACTRFAAWVLFFGWIVMFLWSLLVAMATGLDALLIPPAQLYSIVPIVAFLGQQPRTGRT
jgi:hypothetical protein